MNNDCTCIRLLAMIETTLSRIPASQPDPTRVGTPVAEVVRGMLTKEYAYIQIRHVRNCLPHPTPSLVPPSLEERQGR